MFCCFQQSPFCVFWLFCFRCLCDIKQHRSPWHFRVCLHKDAGEHSRQNVVFFFVGLIWSPKVSWSDPHSLLRSRVSTQEPPALPLVCPQHLVVAAPSTLRLRQVTLQPLTCTSWPPISSPTLRCSTTTCSRTDRWACTITSDFVFVSCL